MLTVLVCDTHFPLNMEMLIKTINLILIEELLVFSKFHTSFHIPNCCFMWQRTFTTRWCFQIFLYFNPEIWWRYFPFWRSYFSNGWFKKPPTRLIWNWDSYPPWNWWLEDVFPIEIVPFQVAQNVQKVVIYTEKLLKTTIFQVLLLFVSGSVGPLVSLKAGYFLGG